MTIDWYRESKKIVHGDDDPMQIEVEPYLVDVDMDNDNVSHCRLHLRMSNA